MSVKLKEIKGLMIEKETIIPPEIMLTSQQNSKNKTIDQQGERFVTLNRDKVFDILYETFFPEASSIGDSQRRELYNLTDELIENLTGLLEATE